MAWKVNRADSLPLTGSTTGNNRVQVDVSQTGFWEGREFRLDHEITALFVIKFSSPINFILQLQSLLSHDGEATFKAYSASQGTPGGTFDVDMGVLPNNGMSDAPIYTPQITAFGGGTFTPNVNEKPREFIKAVSATATAQQSTVGGSGIQERGLPAGDYYLVLTGADAEYHLVYEERP